MVTLRLYKDQYGGHLKLTLFDFTLDAKIHRDFNKAWTAGIRNHTPDGKRVPFMDMDETKIEWLLEELAQLQEDFKLSDFYIFKASQKPDSYHVLGLDKLPFKFWKQILDESSCDEYYKTMPLKIDWKSWVLRWLNKRNSVKPRFIYQLKSKYQDRPKSMAHFLYLTQTQGLKIKKPKYLDNNTILYVINYETANFIDYKGKNIKEKENKE